MHQEAVEHARNKEALMAQLLEQQRMLMVQDENLQFVDSRAQGLIDEARAASRYREENF